MNYIVLDLEWNCVMIPKHARKGIIEHPSEIIEIGAVKLDENKKIIDTFSVLIKPFFIKKVQKYILSVTHITDGELANGIAFPEAVDKFFEWCGKEYIFCTWGLSDLPELRRNLKYYNMDHYIPEDFIDVQIKYALCYEGEKVQRSVKSAVERLKIKDTLDYHRAINDALYTAYIFQKVDLKKADKVEKKLAKMPKVTLKKNILQKVIEKNFKPTPKQPPKVVINNKPLNQRSKPKKVLVFTNEIEVEEHSNR